MCVNCSVCTVQPIRVVIQPESSGWVQPGYHCWGLRDWDWGCAVAFLAILRCVVTALCLCKIHTRFLLTSSRSRLCLIQFEPSNTFVRCSRSIGTLYFLQICNISLISVRRMKSVASHCGRKCVIVFSVCLAEWA